MTSAFPETVPESWLVRLDWLRARIGSALRTIVLLAAAGTWVTFWPLVIRLHVTAGAFLSAAIVGGLFVLPVLAALGYTLRGQLPSGNLGWADLSQVLTS